jgi:hypothetical protein
MCVIILQISILHALALSELGFCPAALVTLLELFHGCLPLRLALNLSQLGILPACITNREHLRATVCGSRRTLLQNMSTVVFERTTAC